MLPLTLIANDVSYQDKRTAPKTLLKGNRVTSSQPNKEEIKKILDPIAKRHKHIIVLTVSSKMSGLYDRYIEFNKEYPNIDLSIVVKPKTHESPDGSDAVSNFSENRLELDFKVTERLDIGSYNIYSILSINNNKLDSKGDTQYGILQFDTPSGVWENFFDESNDQLENKPIDPTKFTDFQSDIFYIYPPKQLFVKKDVKLSSDPDENFASSIGNKGKLGTEIDYRWKIQNNSLQTIDKLALIDILPYNGDKAIVKNQDGVYTDRGSKFKTKLTGVRQEDSDKFNIYYSTDEVKENTHENYNADWIKADEFNGNLANVTMIKAILKDGEKIEKDEEYYIYTHNVIEDDISIKDGEKAYNSVAYSISAPDEADSQTIFIEGLKTEVEVNYPKKKCKTNKS